MTKSPIRVVTVCSGYDSQCMALRRAGIPFDLIAWSEIDKDAILAHNAVFPEYADRNLSDLTKIDWSEVPDFDLFTYSTPCTDISQAGKMQGIEENSGTRSSILWSCRNAIIEKKPKYLLMENVQAIVGPKYIQQLEKWKTELRSYGYTNYGCVMNASEYGTPQKRKRYFMVSVLDDKGFTFPEKVKLTRTSVSMLEHDIPESYYLKSDKQKIKDELLVNADSVELPCLIGFSRDEKGHFINHHPIEIANTVTTFTGGGFTIDMFVMEKDRRWRKLTPKEAFRFMDVEDSDIDKIMSAVKSNTSLFKLAGNSIVVSCMVHIFNSLFNGTATSNALF